MIHTLKRYREPLLVAVLAAVPFAVWLAHARHPGERSAIDRAVVKLTRPVERLVGGAITGVLSGWNGYLALRHSHERARALSQELNQLALDRMELRRVRAENERLRRLLGFAGDAEGWSLVGGRVVGVRLDPKGLQLLVIDLGAEDGVARLMPVLSAEGVVGRVHAVLSHSSEVLLLTDRNSSIAARVDRSRSRANVRGTGEPGACRLDYALRSEDVLEGDLLVTAGTDGVFPRGLPVGRIQGLRRGGQGLYQKAEVAPAVDVTKVEEVLVLLSPRPGASAARAGAP